MVEQELASEQLVSPDSDHVPRFERDLAPGVRLCQEKRAGQFVEIVLPVFELHKLVRECERDFPDYAIALCQATAERRSESITPETTFTSEIIQGMLNTQILGTVLSRHPPKMDESIGVISDLEQAFTLAMKGRLRLIADPLSWSGDPNANEPAPTAANLGPSEHESPQ